MLTGEVCNIRPERTSFGHNIQGSLPARFCMIAQRSVSLHLDRRYSGKHGPVRATVSATIINLKKVPTFSQFPSSLPSGQIFCVHCNPSYLPITVSTVAEYRSVQFSLDTFENNPPIKIISISNLNDLIRPRRAPTDLISILKPPTATTSSSSSQHSEWLSSEQDHTASNLSFSWWGQMECSSFLAPQEV